MVFEYQCKPLGTESLLTALAATLPTDRSELGYTWCGEFLVAVSGAGRNTGVSELLLLCLCLPTIGKTGALTGTNFAFSSSLEILPICATGGRAADLAHLSVELQSLGR